GDPIGVACLYQPMGSRILDGTIYRAIAFADARADAHTLSVLLLAPVDNFIIGKRYPAGMPAKRLLSNKENQLVRVPERCQAFSPEFAGHGKVAIVVVGFFWGGF